jgi:hypothetical protein
MNFEEMAEHIEYDEFSAEIVDGKMVITPADAGVALMGYIQISEDKIATHDKEIEILNSQLDDMRDDNANLRDLLERVYGVLLDNGHETLAEEVITAAYPVRGLA